MLHAEEVIERLDVVIHVLFREVRMVWLQGEMFEDFRALGHKEAPDFLNARLQLEQFIVFQFGAVLRVIAHEVLTQIDAGVKAFSDAGVNRVCHSPLSN